MGIRLTDRNAVAVYDSVSGYCLPMPVFFSEEEAESYLKYCREHGIPDPRGVDPEELDNVREAWWHATHDYFTGNFEPDDAT